MESPSDVENQVQDPLPDVMCVLTRRMEVGL